MSKIEEIAQAVEQLPLTDFVKLAGWVDRRRRQLEILPSATDKSQGPLVTTAPSSTATPPKTRDFTTMPQPVGAKGPAN